MNNRFLCASYSGSLIDMRAHFVPSAALACLAATFACVHGMPCPEKGGPVWREVTSANFAVTTDLTDEDARAFTQGLEVYVAALDAVLPMPPLGERIQVFAPRNGQELAFYVADDKGGFRVQRAIASRTVLDEPLVSASVLLPAWDQHALRDFLLRERLRHWQPWMFAWLDDGLMQLLSTVRVDDRGHVLAGGPVPQWVQLLDRQGLGAHPSWPEFERPKEAREQELYRARAWFLVQHLALRRAAQFRAFLEGLQENREHGYGDVFGEKPADPEVHGVSIGGGSLEPLDRELASTLKAGIYASFETQLRARPPLPGPSTPLSEAELHARWGLAYRHSPDAWRWSVVTEEADEALKHEPTHPIALETADLSPERRVDLLEQATREHPTDWRPWILLWSFTEQLAQGQTKSQILPVLDTLARRLRSGPRVDGPLQAERLEKALALAPDRFPVVAAAAIAKLERKDDGAATLALAAFRLRPSAPIATVLFARGLEAAGRWSESGAQLSDAQRIAEQRGLGRDVVRWFQEEDKALSGRHLPPERR